MADWTALGPDDDGNGLRLVRMSGRAVQMTCACPDAAAAREACRGPVLRIGGGLATPVPAPVLPRTGLDLPAVEQAGPPDRMDGWTRLVIAGFLADQTNWDGVICVAGPACSHWAHASAGEIVSFQSFLTGRLRGALGGAATAAPEAVADTMSRPEALAAQLRRAGIANSPEATTGHLIGAELAAARPYWLGQRVAVIGDAAPQAAALAVQGVPVEEAATEAMRARGLAAVGEALGLTG